MLSSEFLLTNIIVLQCCDDHPGALVVDHSSVIPLLHRDIRNGITLKPYMRWVRNEISTDAIAQ